ncbi:energy-coupling factor transporter transmembrane protein EcfT [bacterium]|nr:energy-coupling factor transporter transmembrane protein EcfT [bacterium]
MAGYQLSSYVPGNSILHRLDPLIKLAGIIAVVSSLLLADNWWKFIPTIILLIVIVCKSDNIFFYLFHDIAQVWLFYIITFAIHCLTNDGRILLSFPFDINVTDAGIIKGIFFSCKIALIVSFVGPIMRTTRLSDWDSAMQNLTGMKALNHFSLRKLIEVLGYTIRFLPLIFQELERIRISQLGRGLRLKGNIINRIKGTIPIIAPIISACFYRADAISASMQMRGYDPGASRSQYKARKLSSLDKAFLLLFAAQVTLSFI